MLLKIDMHVHTRYSEDCLMSLEEVVKEVEKKRLDGVAITDHNTIQGALKLKQVASFEVIVGEEIKTIEGEIVGYFLREKIPPNLAPEETIERIRSQDGLVCIPHPFDRLRRSRLSFQALERIKSEVDIIEVFNARNVFSKDNKKAIDFANKNGFAKIAGSDAHTKYEIGNGYIEIENFSKKDGFIRNVKKCYYFGIKSPIYVHINTKWIKIFGKNN